MKIIFLDVDGVIKPYNSETPLMGLNSTCTKNLKELLEKTGAKIVLSTSWRENKVDLDFLIHQLSKYNINQDDIVGSTPILWELQYGMNKWEGSRGHEIESFIKSNLIDIEKFVILDDDPSPALKDWTELNGLFIQTEMSVGFDENKIKQAIDFFNG